MSASELPAREPEAGDRPRGLSDREAADLLDRHGPNELPPGRRRSLALRALDQVREPLALLLIVAAAVSGLALGERVDAIAILAIVVLNAGIGLVEEGRATRALEALRTMETPVSRVVRDGVVRQVPARELVPGDLVLLSSGDRIPADLRIAEATSFEVNESLLTGESLPVSKVPGGVTDPGVPLGDRTGVGFSGTMVTRGSAQGVVEATGTSTALGGIAEQLRSEETVTPLQQELGRLASRLGAIAVVVSVAVFGLILLRTGVSEESLQEAFLASVALAVAAVPEGLATVVVVGLALGVRRMARRGAIVRRLPAVETLGSTTVLLTDKTGTLTENRLRLGMVAIQDEEAPVPPEAVPGPVAERMSRVAALCSEATLDPPTGDPLEIGLLEAVGAAEVVLLRAAHPLEALVPFDAERRRMTTVHRADGRHLLALKGAPEVVVARSARAVAADGTEVPLDDGARRGILDRAAAMAARGMRTIALAERDLAAAPDEVLDAERDLTLVAVAGLVDPLRAEAPTAVERTRAAGVHLVMVTGDHAGTAAAIAEQAGMIRPGGPVLSGADLREGGIPEDPLGTRVYARVEPEQKLALVEALRERGHVTAVTGDGVNDAPALHRADIGVAMGSGSDVAREAADMVVTDDNLATIVAAVEEGRGIYDNIRKVVDYLVAGNLSEIMVVIGALLLFPALGVPLLPLQLLWINLLTDGLPALALGADPADPGLMSLPPRSPTQRMLSPGRLRVLGGRGLLVAAAAIGSLVVARYGWGDSWEEARAIMFTTLVVAHLLYAFVARRPAPGLLSNGWLVASVLAGIALQGLVVLWPAAHDLFGTTSLGLREWALVALGGLAPVLAMVAIRPLAGRRRG